MDIPSPFATDDGESFDRYDEFVPENLPEVGPFLAGHDVLAGRDHAAFHRLARERFEDRGVYDMTFGYNLARLNLDPRHPDAGFRYAVERSSTSPPSHAREDACQADDPSVLRAEFTPTTEFCPQSDTLCLGAFRAWNGEPGRHEYDLVRVRVAPMHHQAVAINGKLTQLEEEFRESGDLSATDRDGEQSAPESSATGSAATDAPF